VIATASVSNYDLVKSVGAEAVFDYKDPDVASKIRAHVDDMEQAADCISRQDTARQVGECLSSKKGGRVAVILPVRTDEESEMRKDVEYVISWTYDLMGQVGSEVMFVY
jgi:NADPH:quinone reductase-like Zn-dependent oxidoreductase